MQMKMMTLSTILETQKRNILTAKHTSRRAVSTSDLSLFQYNPTSFLTYFRYYGDM